MSPPARTLSEFAMIAKLFAPLAKAEGAFDLTDDAATLRLAPGQELVVTVDAIIEGVHFFRSDPADLIARKALRVNLSDLAAKGAHPRHYLLALSLPDWVDDAWLARFAAGLEHDQAEFGVSLLGGDTTSTPGALTLSITALGEAPAGRMLRRAGAKPGDLVFVTGTVGDAGAGLAALKGGGQNLSPDQRDYLIRRFRLPEPRASLGPKLIGLASAALDVSDGLIADLGHIAEMSKLCIRVEAARVPLSPACMALWGAGPDAMIQAATAGDDYEIAFTAPETARATIAEAANQSGVALHEIGWVDEGSGVLLLDAKGEPLPVSRGGYTHF